MTYAAIVDASGVAVARRSRRWSAERLAISGTLRVADRATACRRCRNRRPAAERFEWSAPLLLDDDALGEIRVVSTLFVHRSLEAAVAPALAAAIGLLLVAVLVAIFLAQAVSGRST